MLLRTCCRTSSEKTRIHVAWFMVSRAFHSAHRSSWNLSSRWQDNAVSCIDLTHCDLPLRWFCRFNGSHKERKLVSTRLYRTVQDRWALYLLSRSAARRRAGPSSVAWASSSSRMFEPLFARLSSSYHLVAPIILASDTVPGRIRRTSLTPSITSLRSSLISTKHWVSRYTLYMQDYGGPVGARAMALAHPERVEALIVQDAVAHNEGLGANWNARREFWKIAPPTRASSRTNLLSLATTRTRHVGNDPNVERYDPDLWTDEFAFFSKPGQAEIQSDLFYDYSAQTSRLILSGRLGCARSNRACSSLGEV